MPARFKENPRLDAAYDVAVCRCPASDDGGQSLHSTACSPDPRSMRFKTPRLRAGVHTA